jgi:hypothetical protein
MRMTARTTSRLVAGCLSALFLATLADAGNPVTLRLGLSEGTQYAFEQTIEIKTSQTIMGHKTVLQQTIGMGFDMRVSNVSDDGVASVQTTFADIHFRQATDNNQTAFAYDSRHPPEPLPPAAAGIAALKGLSFTVKLKPDGTVAGIEGVDRMVSLMEKAIRKRGGPMADVLLESMKKQYNDESLSQQFQSITGFYPDRPVDVGDTWSHSASINLGIGMKQAVSYTLASFNDQTATIAVKGHINSKPAESLDAGQLSMSFDITGTHHGEIKLDRKTGWVIESRLKTLAEGNYSMQAAAGEKPITGPIKIEAVITQKQATPAS